MSSVELLPKLLSCFLPPFGLYVPPTAQQAVLVAGLSPQNPSCWFCLAKSDGYHFARIIAGALPARAFVVPVGDDQLLTRWREGEGTHHCWHYWFGRGTQLLCLGQRPPSVIVLGEPELFLWVRMETLASISLTGEGKISVLGKRRN